MGEEKEDKFASLLKFCKPTPSQESKLRTLPLAREFETFDNSYSDPVSSSPASTSSEPTGIVMVSLPDSSSSSSIDQIKRDDDESEFHTPPEQRFSSSEDQAVDCAVGEPTAVDLGCTGGGVGMDDSGVGNSGSRLVELKKNRAREGGLSGNSGLKKARVSEDLDLEREGENEFAGKNEPIVIEISSDLESEEFDEKTERANMAVDSPMKNSLEKGEASKSDELQMDGLDEMVVEIGKNRKSRKIREPDTVKVTKGEKAHQNGDGEGRRPDSAKNVEEIENFKYVPSAAVVGRKRQLPPSIKGKEKNVRGGQVVSNVRTKNGLLMDFLEVLKAEKPVDSESEEDLDFLETAKRRGLTFPRPRWWPPEEK